MCGIAGQFNFQRREPVERETIVRMTRSIAHRGPDDEGFFISGPVGLGSRRLSIIDLRWRSSADVGRRRKRLDNVQR